ncbi:MAG TPA: hypothetical protein VK879_06100 [Candidatus Sulfomarinibacteraceae bacterium]|nr:hypothetical protein [Candidatus Sulfomarinibacteraceae bacterium]
MLPTPPVARPGDVCILLEPHTHEMLALRGLQRQLQVTFGGAAQQRVHFTSQRFALPDPTELLRVIHSLKMNLAAIASFPVRARCLELVEHPFWEFCVLRWDLQRTTTMWNFARAVHYALLQAGMTPHYPCDDGWRPHVTALEAIASPNGYSVNGQHQGQQLYTARRVTLSQIQEGKQFKILATIPLQSLP